MRPQPKWENPPDKITDIVGGFVDGNGVSHSVPLRITVKKDAPQKLSAMPIEGQWYWIRPT